MLTPYSTVISGPPADPSSSISTCSIQSALVMPSMLLLFLDVFVGHDSALPDTFDSLNRIAFLLFVWVTKRGFGKTGQQLFGTRLGSEGIPRSCHLVPSARSTHHGMGRTNTEPVIV